MSSGQSGHAKEGDALRQQSHLVEVEHEAESGHGAHGSHGEHEEGGHGEPWLVSYADLMTLLFGFFVIMYTFAAAKSSPDKDTTVRLKREIASYFGGKYVNPLEQTHKKIEDKLKQDPVFSANMVVKPDGDGLKVVIRSQLLFEAGSADISPGAISILEQLVTIIREAKIPLRIKVTGFTDDVPIHSTRFPSNWDLSASRAASVIRLFENAGIDPELLSAEGQGSTHPAYPNLDDAGHPLLANRARNRRVEIKISQAGDATTHVGPPAPVSTAVENTAVEPTTTE